MDKPTSRRFGNASADIRHSKRMGETPREAEARRALIEFAISLGGILLLEESLLPYHEVTRQQIQIGTVLIYIHLWFLFYGLIHPANRS